MMKQTFLYEETVHSSWVDYNGHMNDAAYAKVFSLAADELIDFIGLDAAARSTYDYTMFTLENHICYLKEAHESEKLLLEAQLLDRDVKRLHLFFTMKNKTGDTVATSEQMLMGMDVMEGRPASFPQPVEQKVEEMRMAHKELAAPKQAGRKIGIVRKL